MLTQSSCLADGMYFPWCSSSRFVRKSTVTLLDQRIKNRSETGSPLACHRRLLALLPPCTHPKDDHPFLNYWQPYSCR
jgi:hypothetical protein